MAKFAPWLVLADYGERGYLMDSSLVRILEKVSKTDPPGLQASSVGYGRLAQEIRWVLLGPCRCRRVPLRCVEEFGRAYVETPEHGARYGL